MEEQETVTQLVPFDVYAMEPPNIEEEYLRLTKQGGVEGANSEYLSALSDFWNYHADEISRAIHKVWKVAAVRGNYFLLVRAGEFTLWYPQRYCMAKGPVNV